MEIGYNYEKFMKALSVMGMGMLGIFIVMGVIIASVIILNKLTSKKPPKK